MSVNIEEQVVKMIFDNKDFESNVKDSMNTISNLKNSLEFKKSNDGLHNLSQSVKNCNMDQLSKSVENCGEKFSVLEFIGKSALASLTFQAVSSATRIAKSMTDALTLGPVKNGFGLYEQKINSTQTAMTNTGESLEKVTAALDELNAYSDKTIFKFSDMTQSLGKFSAAGVSLDQTVQSIKGISNVAAAAGASTADAGRAFYNIAQAYSVGAMKLIDWKSIENANMATKEFKQQIIEAAKAVGTLDKEGKNAAGELVTWQNLREYLKDGIMTTEVMNKVFSEYANTESEVGKKAYAAAQDIKTFTQLWDVLKESVATGWAKSFSYIVGDFNEAKESLTAFSNVISGFFERMNKVRNTNLEAWKNLNGRKELIEALKNAFNALLSVTRPVAAAFRDVFRTINGIDISNFTVSLKNLTKSFTLNEKDGENLRRTFRGIFAAFDIGIQVATGLLKAIDPIIITLKNISKWLLSITAKVGDHIYAFDTVAKKTKIFIDLGDSLSKLFATLIVGSSELFKTFFNFNNIKTTDFFQKFKDSILNVISMTGTFNDGLIGIINSLNKGILSLNEILISKFAKAVQIIPKLLDGVVSSVKGAVDLSAIGKIINGFVESLKSINIGQIVNTLAMGNLTYMFTLIISTISSTITSVVAFKKVLFETLASIRQITSNVNGILISVRSTLQTYQNTLKAKALRDIGVAIAILAGSLLLLSLIPVDNITVGLMALGGALMEMATFIGLLELIITVADQGTISTLIKMASVLITMAGAIVLFAASLIVLTGCLAIMQKFDKDKLSNSLSAIAVTIIAFSAAIAILSGTVGAFSSIGGAIALNMLITSLLKLVFVFSVLNKIDGKSLAKGFAAIVGTIIAFVSAMAVIKYFDLAKWGTALSLAFSVISTSAIKASIASLIISKAINTFAPAIRELVSLPWYQFSNIWFASTILTGAMKRLAKFSNDASLFGSVAVYIMANGIKVLVPAFSDFCNIPWYKMDIALIRLLEFSLVLRTFKANVGHATGILILAFALNLFIPTLLKFGELPFGKLVKGCFAISTLVKSFGATRSVALAGSIGLYLLATSIAEFMPVVDEFSKLPFTTAIKAAAKLWIFLKILSSARNESAGIGDILSSIADSILATDVYESLIPAIKELAKIDFGTLLKSLLKMRIAMSVFAGGATAMGAAAPMVLLAAGALYVMSIAIAASIASLASVKDVIKDFAESLGTCGLVFLELSVGIAALAFAVTKFSEAKWGKIIKSIFALGGLGIVVKAITPSLIELSKVNPAGALASIVMLGGVLGELIFLAMKLSDSQKSILKGMALIALFSLDILALAKPLVMLSEMKSTIGSSIGIIITLAGTVGSLAMIAKELSEIDSNYAKGIIGIGAIAGAIWLLGEPLRKISSLHINNAIAIVGAIGGSLAIISALASGLSKLENIAAGILSVALLAATLKLILVPALEELSKIDTSNINHVLGIMAGIVVVLGIISAVLSGMPEILIGVGILAAIISLVILASTSFAIFANAVQVLSDALVTGGDSIIKIGNAIIPVIQGIVSALTSFVTGILESIASGFIDMINAFVGGIERLSVALPALIGSLSSIGMINLTGVGIGLVAVGVGLTAVGVGGLLLSLAAAGIVLLAASIVTLSNALAIFSTNGIVQFIAGIKNGLTNIAIAGVSMIKALVIGIKSSVSNMTLVAYDAIAGFINGIKDNIKAVAASGVAVGAAFIAGIRSKDGIDSHSPGKNPFKAAVDGVAGWINGIKDNVKNIYDSGVATGKAYIEGLKNSVLPDVDAITNQISSEMRAAMNFGSWFSGPYVRTSATGHYTDSGHFISDIEGYYDKNGHYNKYGSTDEGRKAYIDKYVKKIDESKSIFGDLNTITDSLTDNLDNVSDGLSGIGGDGGSAGSANKSVSDLVSTIEGAIDIFSKFDNKTETTADQMLENMRSQVNGVKEWSHNIALLSTKGIDQGLLKKLGDMGPKSYDYVNAFVNMTSEQLAEANSLFAESLTLPQQAADVVGNSYAIAGAWASEGFANGIDAKPGTDAAVNMAMSALNGLNEALDINSPSRKTYASGQFFDIGLGNGIDDETKYPKAKITVMCRELLKVVDEKFSGKKAKETGINFVIGIGNGIGDTETQSTLFEKIKSLGKKMINTLNKSLDEHSPSRLTEKSGANFMFGLRNGITKNSKYVTDSIKESGNNAINTLQRVINGTGDTIDYGLNLNPTIRPVLDLTQLQNGASQINTMFDSSRVGMTSSMFGEYMMSINSTSQTQQPTIDQIVDKVGEKYASVIRESMNGASVNVTSNVALQGDARGIFNMVRDQNSMAVASTGKWVLAPPSVNTGLTPL